MPTYDERVALSGHILATTIRTRILQKIDIPSDFEEWAKKESQAEFYSIISRVFTEQFIVIPASSEGKLRDFAGRITNCLVANHAAPTGIILDAVDKIIKHNMETMCKWCREIMDVMYNYIDTDKYRFLW